MKKIKLALVNTIKDMESAPLGLAYLATFLKKNKNVEVRIVDRNFEEPFSVLKKLRPDVVGISSVTLTFNYAKKLARMIKGKLGVPVIIGGVHISTHPQSFSKEFNVGVLGEGEETLLELMEVFEGGKFDVERLRKIKGITFWNSGKVVKTEKRELIDLKKVAVPDRSFLDSRYFEEKITFNRLQGERVKEAGILTSRGCPYDCVFCSTKAFWSKVRFHSAEHVVSEIKMLHEDFGINFVNIYDDMFAVNLKILMRVLNGLKKENLVGKIKIACSLRANIVNDKICEILKEMGVVTVNFGFESGSEKILRYLKGENVSVDENKKAVELCRKHGLEVNGSFIIGSPSEKIEDMEATLDLMRWMKEKGARELWCGVATPYPGTRLWEYAISHGLLEKFEWDRANPAYVHEAVFLDKAVGKREFLRIFKKIKELSYESSVLQKQNKKSFVRKVRDFVYYNRVLFGVVSKLGNLKNG